MSGLETLKEAAHAGLPIEADSRYVLDAMSTVTDFRTDMLDLLWLHHVAECLDPKDRLFALSLLLKKQTRPREGYDGSDFEEEDSEKDSKKDRFEEGTCDDWYQEFSYDQGWSDLYRGFALMSIERHHGLRLLFHLFAFGQARVRNASLPSWVPDWSNRRRFIHSLPGPDFIRSTPFEDGRIPANVLTVGKDSAVMLEACEQGEVLQVIGNWASDTSLSDVRSLLSKFLLHVRDQGSCRMHGGHSTTEGAIFPSSSFRHVISAISKILCATPGLFQHRSTFFSDTSFEARYSIGLKIELWLEQLLKSSTKPGLRYEDLCELTGDANADTIPTRIRNLLERYSLYRLCSGVVGLGPQDLQNGDLIVDFPDGHLQGIIAVTAPHISYLSTALRPFSSRPQQLCRFFGDSPKSQILGPCFSPVRLECDHCTKFELC
jgi:hypothetical protein